MDGSGYVGSTVRSNSATPSLVCAVQWGRRSGTIEGSGGKANRLSGQRDYSIYIVAIRPRCRVQVCVAPSRQGGTIEQT
jgi:uncharacterized protein (UPF0262 family)